MNDEPMNDGSDKVRPPEPGMITKLLSIKDARPHYAQVNFTPHREGLPPINGWRMQFPSRSTAQEWAQTLDPSHRDYTTGSPKQAKYKRAARLRIRPDQLDLYTYSVEIKEKPADDANAPNVRGAWKRNTKAADGTRGPDLREFVAGPGDGGGPEPADPTGGTVHGGPADDLGVGPDLLGAVLPSEENGIRSDGEPPEDRPFVAGPKA